MRKVIIVVMSAIICFGLTSCSDSKSDSKETFAQIEELTQEVAKLTAEKDALLAKVSEYELIIQTTKDEEAKIEAEKVAVEEEKKKLTPIQLNEKIITENHSEVEIVDVYFSKKLSPSNPSGYYSYYEVKENGNIYLIVKSKVKSLLSIGKDASEFMGARLQYDGNYEYTGFTSIEKKGGSDLTGAFFERVEPLTTVTLYDLIEVPDEVSDSGKPVTLFITINGKTYEYNMR